MSAAGDDSVDRDEHGVPVTERYRRLGASGQTEGLYVRFEPGFGLNVHIGFRICHSATKKRVENERLVLGIDGWERLGELVDEWRERQAKAAS